MELEKPNKNGRTYPTHVIKAALLAFKEKTQQDMFPIFKEPSLHHSMEDIVGFATNVRVEDGFLQGNIGFIEGKIEHILSDEIINIRPNGIGSVKDGIIQEDYRITGFSIVRKPV